MHRPKRQTALTPRRTCLLLYLLEAHETSSELAQPVWNFACQLTCLLQSGITESDLRWLLHEGLGEHRTETRPSETLRTFDASTSPIRFQPASCFLLSESGIALARNLRDVSAGERTGRGGPELRLDQAHAEIRPHYDSARRVLSVGSRVVKEFRVPAHNQELILSAFEEEGWPPHVDDPLPPNSGMDDAKRLQHAIYRLNLRQANRLIRFEGNGKGTGIKWRWVGGGLEVD
jgi:hypothetical protein